MVVAWYCTLSGFGRMLFFLACTPPPGPAASHKSPQSFLAHSLSHLVLGSGIVRTHMRTAPRTPGL